ANGNCKKLLKSLTNPNPILVEITEAFNHLGTLEHTSKTMAAGMAAAFAALKSPTWEQRTCFGCGKPGHLKNYCFAQNGDKAKAPGTRPWCRKGRYFTNQCCSKY
ncbi:GAK5 protein, partial [Donacobius atricapilla]|nr:GAK5 protein [Donacobius atricapilla]